MTAPDGGLPGVVSIDSTDPEFLHVTVQVTWVGERGAQTVALRTQMADVHPQ